MSEATQNLIGRRKRAMNLKVKKLINMLIIMLFLFSSIFTIAYASNVTRTRTNTVSMSNGNISMPVTASYTYNTIGNRLVSINSTSFGARTSTNPPYRETTRPHRVGHRCNVGSVTITVGVDARLASNNIWVLRTGPTTFGYN